MLDEIKRRESSNNYAAKNRDSTASGAYQFINSTWRMASHETKAPYYATAAEAPPEVQDQNALHMLRKYGPNATITWSESGPYNAGKISDKTTSAPASAAPAESGSAQDLISRIAGGENIEITPQVIARIIQGPKKAPPTPPPVPPPAPALQPYKIVESRPIPPEPTTGEQLLHEAVINPAKQVAAGALSASATANRMTANVAHMADSLSDWISTTTGLPKGGLFKNISDWARTQQVAQEKQAADLAGGRTDLPSQILRGGTEGLLDIPTYVVAGRVVGPVAGMAMVGAIRESDQGWQAALKAAAEGALTGGALEVMGPASRAIRLTGAGAMAYAQARLQGVDNTTALAHAVTTGGLAGAAPGGATASEIFPRAAEVVGTAGAVAKGAVTGAVKGGFEPVPVTKFGVEMKIPKVFITAPAGAAAARAMTLPAIPGAVVGGVAPFVTGGIRGAREVLAERTAARTPEAAAPAAKPAPAEPVTPAGAPTDEALLHLYSVETDPAKRTALRQEMVDRGLVQEPSVAPEQNPYRDYSQTALQKTYAVETNPAKRVLIEQAARDRNLTLHTRETRRATTAVPETGTAEPRGPSLTQDEALMLRHLGIEDPLSADPDSIAVARQFVAEHPDLVQQLRSGTPEKPAAPVAAPAAAPVTEPRPAPAAALVPTLDEIAQGDSGKPFARLSAADQERVRNVRAAMERSAAGTTEAPPPRPAAAPVRPAPVEPPPPPGKTAAELLQEEIAAKRAAAAELTPQQTPAEAQAAFEQAKTSKTIPVQQGEAPAQAKADFEARQRVKQEEPATPLAAAAAAPAKPQNLSDLMAGELPDIKQPGRSPYTETGELKSARQRGQEHKLANIEAKAQRWSDALTAHGVDPADVAKIQEGWVTAEAMKAGSPPGWENVMHDLIAKGLLDKAEKRPPSESIPRINELMQQKQIAKPAAPQNLSELMKPPKPKKAETKPAAPETPATETNPHSAYWSSRIQKALEKSGLERDEVARRILQDAVGTITESQLSDIGEIGNVIRTLNPKATGTRALVEAVEFRDWHSVEQLARGERPEFISLTREGKVPDWAIEKAKELLKARDESPAPQNLSELMQGGSTEPPSTPATPKKKPAGKPRRSPPER